ncbi:MAG: lipoprotein-releasing ABC transporter permease subunit [Candidatus Glassbacteria bacterium]
MRLELFIGLRYLLSNRGTRFLSLITWIAIGGVFLGVTALNVVLAVMNGLQNDLRDKILGMNAHVLIMSEGLKPFDDYQGVLEAVREEGGVIAAAPFVYTEAIVTNGTQYNEGVVVRGVDPDLEPNVTNVSKNMIGGAFAFEDEESGEDASIPAIVMGYMLANRLRVHVGDTVKLYSPSASTITPIGLVPRAYEFRLSGVFKTGLYEYDSKFTYLSLGGAQAFLNLGDSVHGIEVKVNDIYDADNIGRSIIEKLGPPYFANDWMSMNRNLFSALKLEKTAMFIILVLIVLVASFTIISTIIMMVNDRIREIGILKSMGLTSRSIMKVFLTGGLMIGIAGTFLGCLGGYGLAALLEKYKFISLPADVYWIDKLPVQMEATDFVTVALVSTIISIIAAVYPAYRASKLYPVEAIRYE